MDSVPFPEDVKERARAYLKDANGSVGAYTQSQVCVFFLFFVFVFFFVISLVFWLFDLFFFLFVCFSKTIDLMFGCGSCWLI